MRPVRSVWQNQTAQDYSGRQATANAKESLAWGTNIVGGVTPGREGEHLGLPLLPSVRKVRPTGSYSTRRQRLTLSEAAEVLQPDATGIYVAAHQAAAAIEEAIEAEVPLVVAVAEHIPLHDMIRVSSIRDPMRLIPTTTDQLMRNPDTLDTQNTVQVTAGGTQLTGHHLGCRVV